MEMFDLRADLFFALVGCLALPCGADSFLACCVRLLLPSVLRVDWVEDAASPDVGVCSPLLVFFGLFRR